MRQEPQAQQTKTFKGGVTIMELKPDEAIAFTKRQWLNLIKRLCNHNLPDGLFISRESEYHICVSFTENKRLPFAKVIIATVKEENKNIKRNEKWKKAVIEAIKNLKPFKRLLREYEGCSIYWKHELWSSELKYTKSDDYPVFYVILNNSNLSTKIPM